MNESASRRRYVALCLATALLAGPAAGQTLPWMNRNLPPEKRTELLVSAMTQEEKFQQMVGQPGVVPELPQCYGGRHVPGVPRLAIPTFRITNGPVGVGQNDCVPIDKFTGSPGSSLMTPHSAKATALPAAIGLAASFDRAVAEQFGHLLGKQSRNLALHVMEAPGINLARMPHGGRNFEYFGEDPYLAGTMSVAVIRAIQAQGVIAMPKHYIANEQETDRKLMNAIIDDRALHQLYLLPFEMSVKEGDAASIMCSYNTVNGSQMCENRHLLTEVLRGQWGFKGYVQSDFFAVQSLRALRAGMDHEMPGFRLNVPGMLTWFTPENFKPALAKGEIAMSDIDTALSRRYLQMFRLGIFDRPLTQTPIDIKGDGATAARIGEQTAVLLKNDKAVLPFDVRSLRSIALIGKQDYAAKAVVGGGGSSQVIPFYEVPALEGMKRTLSEMGAGTRVTLTIVADDNSNLQAAVAAAKKADAVVILAGALSTEGKDLANISLPKGQDAMITAVAAANPRTALVLKDNAAILMPWIDDVPAVLETWFPGQEDGVIVSRLLLGLANPSGKLPVTYPRSEKDLPGRTPLQWPGVLNDKVRRVEYSEGLKIGYRWFDAERIKPLFPFGHGLSYTSFKISDVSVAPTQARGFGPIKVRMTLRNTGKVRGAEVPQVYLGLPANTGEPPKRLVAFEKVWLEPGEQRQIEMTIDPAASNHPFGIYDPEARKWVNRPGTYTVMVGTSSANLAHSRRLALTE